MKKKTRIVITYIEPTERTYTQTHKLNPIHFRDYFSFFSVLSYVIRLIVSQSLVKNVTFFFFCCVRRLLLFLVPDSFDVEYTLNITHIEMVNYFGSVEFTRFRFAILLAYLM